jgi:hypothetical protein
VNAGSWHVAVNCCPHPTSTSSSPCLRNWLRWPSRTRRANSFYSSGFRCRHQASGFRLPCNDCLRVQNRVPKQTLITAIRIAVHRVEVETRRSLFASVQSFMKPWGLGLNCRSSTTRSARKTIDQDRECNSGQPQDAGTTWATLPKLWLGVHLEFPSSPKICVTLFDLLRTALWTPGGTSERTTASRGQGQADGGAGS